MVNLARVENIRKLSRNTQETTRNSAGLTIREP